MNTTLSWIREYVPDLRVTAKEYSDAMTLSGTKVEGFRELDRDLDRIVVGEVLSCEPHPDSDHLHVCMVDTGDGEARQIVCGAPNVAAGQKVPVVLPGGRVAGSRDGKTEEGGIEIKAGKVRGIESFGMICSIEELGSSREFYPEAPEGGIYVFPADTPAGSDAIELLGMRDADIEYEITSNRVDCYSVIGIAREAAATFGLPFHPPVVPETGCGEDASAYIEVENRDPELCARYIARIVKDVKIGPSPLWLQRRLAASGIRPINNVVDITNYVMEEYGQPMHAFDYDTIGGRKIVVRCAADGDVFTTLDGVERKLDHDVLMICDAEREVAIAGIMGGENSMITENAKTVLFEAACFNGNNIRRSSKRIGLMTDASQKFDKGLDPENTLEAINRACALMEEFGAGTVVSGRVDSYPGKREIVPVPFDPEKINALLGTDVPEEEMLRIFDKLELAYDPEKKEIVPPAFRQDIGCIADLAEEVARFTGYDTIPETLPAGEATEGKLTFAMRVQDAMEDAALACGFSQGYSYSFESPKVYDRLRYPEDAPERHAIRIANPLGEDFSVMRTVSVNGMLTSLATNCRRRNEGVRLFETGNIYLSEEDVLTRLPEERKIVTLGMVSAGDFFVMKGVAENILSAAGLTDRAEFAAAEDIPFLHPGRCARISYRGSEVGFIGEVHPETASQYGISGRAYLAALDLTAILPFAGFERKYTGIARHPAISRDISIVVPHEITAGEIEKMIAQRGGKLLESYTLFDLYEGEQVEAGKKSMAYTLVFRNRERTLSDDEVAGAMKKILNGLDRMGIALRS